VALEKYAKYHPDQLSGGMQQKVSIARALAYDPDILLMDEPFGALDEINRRKMNDSILDVWKNTGKTILFVTHSIEEAIYLSQKIIVLTRQPGTVREIIPIKLPYPRKETLDDITFFKLTNKIRNLLEDEEPTI
jgi:NitT/TauT family transport system ATP-binding protein